MPNILFHHDNTFEERFTTLLANKLEQSDEVNHVVIGIINDIRTRGDAALLEYTKRFDRLDIPASDLRISQAEIDAAYSKCSNAQINALQLAAERIKTYHERQMPQDFTYTDSTGTTLGNRWTSIDRAGLYVPGGLASYPSSVLMNAIPAKVAGVKELVMVVPTPDGIINPLVLVAAHIAGITEIYRIGGAQAVAALAYGTDSVKPVDKIVGPGNAYVAAAKRHVFGQVGIDMIAGPSEILVVSDKQSNPQWVAADLLSQAEHDKAARSILITDDAGFADDVIEAVKNQLNTLARKEIAEASWHDNGMVIVVKNLQEALPLIDRIAAEHLEIMVDNPAEYAKNIRHAGALFLGRHTPEAIGDYTAGPSHVLPTAGTARFSSGLSVFDFLKRSSVIECSASSFKELAEATEILANSEGLGAHALSITVRKE